MKTTSGQDATTRPAHTPGPWDASHDADGDYAIFSFGGILVCVTEADTSEDAANAHLIAAAPDLLASLKAMTSLMQTAADEIDTDSRHPMRGYGGKTVRENIHAANQAIAKAGGQ